MIDKHDKKYEAIAREIVKLLASHDLTIEEVEYIAVFVSALIKRGQKVNQLKI